MDVSIIIVNYNTCNLTSDCICSIIEKTSSIDYEIIVVDNASTDGSREFFSTDNRIKYIYLDSNIGFGKANNRGVEAASGKYLFFLNSDTLLVNNAVKMLFDFLESNSGRDNIACVGCMLEDKDGVYLHSYGKFPSAAGELAMRLMWPVRRFLKRKATPGCLKLSDDAFAVDYVTGADIFLAHDIVERFGGFNPEFFMYYEETEMQLRYHKAGLKNMIVPGPRIIHLEGASVKPTTCLNQKNSGKLNNRIRFSQKSNFIYMRLKLNPVAYYTYRILFYLVRLPYLLSLNKDERKEYNRILLGK